MAEQFPAEIEEQMHIKPLPNAPDNLQGVLTQAQLAEFPEQERPVLFAISKLEQLIRWHILEVGKVVNSARDAEAALIKKTSQAKRACLWTIGVVVTAIAYAAAEHLFK